MTPHPGCSVVPGYSEVSLHPGKTHAEVEIDHLLIKIIATNTIVLLIDTITTNIFVLLINTTGTNVILLVNAISSPFTTYTSRMTPPLQDSVFLPVCDLPQLQGANTPLRGTAGGTGARLRGGRHPSDRGEDIIQLLPLLNSTLNKQKTIRGSPVDDRTFWL